MDNEASFRAVAAVLVALATSITLRFRLAAAKSGERLWSQRRQEGTALLLLRVIFAFLLWGGVVLGLIAPSWMAWSRVLLPDWLRWLAAGLVAGTMPLLYWVLKTLGTNLTDTVAIRREHTLVSTGPYRWVRHPFYVANSLGLAALALLLANWLLGLGLVLFWMYLWRRTPIEEAKLVERFGDEYRAYRARTGRFVPRFGRELAGLHR